MFREKFGKAVLGLFGWKVVNQVKIPEKCVFCIAPHTSNWDFFVGLFAYPAIGGKDKKFMIKKDWFAFPFNLFFKAVGGIPVDRSKKVSTVDQIVEACNNTDHFHLAITPEGTRSANSNWKRGFYYIAKKANIPIIIVYFDYKKKEAGLKEIFYPTDDAEADMTAIKEFYRDVTAKYPEKFAI